MSNDHDDQAVQGQPEVAGPPAEGSGERSGEPVPADVIAAAAAAAEAVAAATAASVAAGSTTQRGSHRATHTAAAADQAPPSPLQPADAALAAAAATPPPTAAPIAAQTRPNQPAWTQNLTPSPIPTLPPAEPTSPAAPASGATAPASSAAPADTDAARPAGSAAIGGYRPWAAALEPIPEPTRRLPPRRLMVLVGGVALVVVLIAAAATGVFGGGGSTATPPASRGAVGAASAAASPSAAGTPVASRTPGLSPSVAASPSPVASTGSTPPPGPVTASSALSTDLGAVVSTDTFTDSHSGWPLPKANSAVTTYQYTSSGYVIGSRTGAIEHLIYAPYRTARSQLSMAVTASLSGAPKGAGFGLTCRRGSDAAERSYTMVILNTGSYYIERYDGVPSLTSNPKTLAHGTWSVAPGSSSFTVVGMCATISPGTTRVALFAGDQEVAEVTDSTVLSGTGWAGGIDMASGKTTSSLIVTGWVERDLTR